jgi:hypothetical protein
MFIKENRVNIYKPMFEIKDKKIAKPSIIQTNDKQNNQGEVNKDVLQNQIKREDPNMKKPIFHEDQKEKINKEKDFKEMTNPAPVPPNKPAEKNRKVEDRYPDKWEQIRKVPDRSTAPPVNLKPIQVPKSINNQLKKVPVNKEVIKRVP